MRGVSSNTLRRANRVQANALPRWRLPLLVFAFLLFGSWASAQTNIYHIRGNASAGSNNIWSVDATTGAETLVYANYPGGNAATVAQRPSDGMVFYAINPAGGSNGPVYSFNPATPGVAPILLGSLGGTVGTGFRMAFFNNTLYYMPAGGGADTNTLYTVNQATGVATSVATITGTNNGGDMAFLGNTLYIVDQNRNLFTATTAGGAATAVGTITFGGATPNTIGLAFDGAGRMLVQTVSATLGGQFWSVTGTTATLISALGGGTTATGDMASANVPLPNLAITKTDGVTTVYRGGPVTYTIVVTNSGTYTVTGTVADTVPASVTTVSWTCAASAGSTCAAASGAGNAVNTSATLLAGGTATYTVTGTIAAGASGSLTNTATVAVPVWLTDSNPANNTASDTDTINLNANLAITKTDGLANINPGSAVTYTIVVSNAGPDTSNGSIVTDTVPATITGVTWTCGAVTGGATCGAASGAGNSINTTANLPSGGSVTYTVSGTLVVNATGTLSNTATVLTPASGVTDPNDPTRTGAANNSATDTTIVNPVADVRIAKSHAGNFTVGVNGTYTLTASNSGTLATSGTITVIDNLPAGLTIAALPTGTGWNCSTTVVGSSTATCTSATVIAAGATSPNPITVTVVVAPAAFPAVTNAATISGGGEPASVSGNNSASDPTTVNGVADVRIAKSHAGNFTVGVNGTYTLTASNSGTLATSGTITVIDNLPAGLTIAALPTGTGWNCSTTVVGSSTATCTSATVIAAGATSPNPITVTVVVAPAAFPAVTNAATISGGGEPAYNNGNNSASDPTTVNGVPDLTIAKTHVGNFTQGQVGATYSITATNSGTAATSGTVTVTDTLPVGLTATAISGAGWACVLGTLTCTRGDVLAAGATYPVITLTVTVANNAPASVTNSVSVSGGGQNNTANDTATDATTINQLPDLTIAKSHVGNFTQGQVGATYSITATNSGFAATSGTVTVTDTLPVGLTATAISGGGWACVLGTLTCTRSDALAAGASYPVITLTVTVANNAPASVTNSVNVSGGGQTNTGNDSATDPTTINGVADVRIAKSHVGNFTVGVNGTYTLTASNSGTGATSGTITVIDNLPAGLTIAALPTGTGWNCATTVIGSSTATCTSATVIAAGATSPNPITVTVVVAPAAFPSVTNAATISGGGEPAFNNANNSANDPTNVNGVADVRIAKSHAGNFTVGVNGTYTLTASNSGTLATSGTITVVDNLPAGLTIAALPTGTGWNCSTTVVGSSTATCTSAAVIAAGATSLNPITVTVVVAPAAFPSVTNSATISGGGEPAYNNGNNTVTDPTTVNGVPDLTIAKSHVGNFTQGQSGAAYSITVTNSGTAATSGTVTVTDNLPAGLTVAAIPTGTGWNCSTTVVGSSTATCTRNDALAVSASYPVITLTVNVSLTAPASVTNSATVSGGGENNASNDTANDLTTINAAAPPSVALVKSVSPGGTQIPGTDLLYTIVYTNSGGQPANNLVIVDPNPANAVPAERIFHNVDFKIGSLTSSPGTSGLVASFQYSNDGGTTWTYVPVSGAGGAPAGYDRVVTNVRWSFAGSLSQTGPNNTGSVGLTVQIR